MLRNTNASEVFLIIFFFKEKGDGNSLIVCVEEEDNMIHNQEGFFLDDVTKSITIMSLTAIKDLPPAVPV